MAGRSVDSEASRSTVVAGRRRYKRIAVYQPCSCGLVTGSGTETMAFQALPCYKLR